MYFCALSFACMHAGSRLHMSHKVQGPVCSKYAVKAFPTMRLGRAEDFAEERLENLKLIEPRHRDAKGVIAKLESVLNT